MQLAVTAAPLIDSIHPLLQNSHSLYAALTLCENNLQQIAAQSNMVIALADVGGTIFWTQASRHMRSAAEKVHFVAGGQWGEEHVGTNALALSLKTEQASCVISDEHLMESVYDWVCYAAPIIDPFSKKTIGVIDLSTKLNQRNSLGLIAAEHCAIIIQQALLEHKKQSIYIQALGAQHVFFNNQKIALSPRQIEILTILSLHPQGLTLEQLHQALYGERKITQSTLKAEISQLRTVLNGLIGSRPYKLLVHVDADFLELERNVNAGYLEPALRLASGVFLAYTDSPFLTNWRIYLESRLSFLIAQTEQTDVLLRYLAYSGEALDAFSRILELVPNAHPIHKLLTLNGI